MVLVLIALGILAYYFGTTQYFTVQGKAHYLIVSEKQLLLLKKLLNRQDDLRDLLVENYAFTFTYQVLIDLVGGLDGKVRAS